MKLANHISMQSKRNSAEAARVKSRQRGFTLIEWMMAIAIRGILPAIALPLTGAAITATLGGT